MNWKNILAGFFAMTVLSMSFAVGAQSPEEEAKVSFDEGKALYARGEYANAALRFREAYRINPSWKLLYNIGQAEASSKRYGLALEAFEGYLLEGGDEISPGRQDEIIKETNRLRAFVGMLEIRAPEGVEIVVEDVVRGTTPLPGVVPVSAGKNHEVRAMRDGVLVGSKVVRVMVGQTVVVELEVKAAEETPVEETTPPPAAATETMSPAQSQSSEPDKGKKLRIAGWVTAGIGAGALIGSAVTGGLAMSKNSDIEENCPEGICPAGEDWDAEIESRDALGITTTVLLAAGGALLVAGTVMIIVGYKKGSAERVSLSPVLAPEYAGAVMNWRF